MTPTEIMSEVAKGITFKQRLFFAFLGLLALFLPGFVFTIVMRGIAQAVKKLAKDDAEFVAFFSAFCES